MIYEGVYDFYVGRITSCPLYGFRAGSELLDLIVRCAAVDSLLTADEYNSIIKQADDCHKKLMEDNYNEGFQQNTQG